MALRIGIDIGSTTVKVVVLDEQNKLLFRSYERHYSKARERTCETLRDLRGLLAGQQVRLLITGSAGLGVAKASGLDFVQEVYATAAAVREFIPGTDAVIELGGEDAKIIFFGGTLEERMNGSCAGGTGAFIDQMATLLNVSVDELDALSLKHEKIYPIASRCGVFAKSDIQPILNQGGRKEDVAASIFQAVVDQTVAGLTQGRELTGKIVFLGGPLHFLMGLRERFVDTLKLDSEHAIFPEDGDCFAAIGAALCTEDSAHLRSYEELLDLLEHAATNASPVDTMPPLFTDPADYEAFSARHSAMTVPTVDLAGYTGDAYLGIDAGSTTTKMVLIDPDCNILYAFYHSNQGNPVSIVRPQLQEIYAQCGDRVTIRGAAVTGYGEDLIKNAFSCDLGLVETVAHLNAARHFTPDVDFIIDIGGQDMKCFKIRNGAVDSILLNEACSSGCGSFIETFAKALGYTIADFSKMGLFAQHPVNLGSRCTVFMNSSVKQAQKDGASIEDISAGLSISVVKNAIYKVIRAASADDLGQHIVVQGGTFLNDAVLRSFEQEIGRQVTRPTIAGMMGAYGAALAAKEAGLEKSSLLSPEALATFTHEARPATCKGCTNRCSLTINKFDGGRRFISGNRCSVPLGQPKADIPDLLKFKYDHLRSLQGKGQGDGSRGKIGLPFGLNMYENLPFWFSLFTSLNFEVVLSPESTRRLYIKGQRTIPSDTVCYPAKLLHGHIMALLEEGIDTIFYPCMSYNFDEGVSDNHYNCPVVAYYPDLLSVNIPALAKVRYIHPNIGIHRPKDFEKKGAELLEKEFGVPRRESVRAIRRAYAAYDDYRALVRTKGQEYIDYARKSGKKILVVAGRPYHMDPEINHGINDLITSFGFVLITEDAVFHHMSKQPRHVLNQWTYHARMYNAARYVCTQPDMAFIQLVSFGCGVDAITTDEVRRILEDSGRIYTQIKIDEITNLGAVKIRLRSLFSAIGEKGGYANG
ncbi:MAG: acyl-CoA dehydratase activase [Clostridiales bacterium]|nr:acyl-CoA dehydratase activase [Clostridiales bacterium]